MHRVEEEKEAGEIPTVRTASTRLEVCVCVCVDLDEHESLASTPGILKTREFVDPNAKTTQCTYVYTTFVPIHVSNFGSEFRTRIRVWDSSRTLPCVCVYVNLFMEKALIWVYMYTGQWLGSGKSISTRI